MRSAPRPASACEIARASARGERVSNARKSDVCPLESTHYGHCRPRLRGPPARCCEEADMHALLLAALFARTAIDDAVRLVMRTQHVAGLSIGIARDGKTLYERGYGWSDLGKRAPARAQTIYRIGSLTKSFTAAAILQLQREGKLALSDRVDRLLPGFAWNGITIEDLLAHESGIPSYSDDDLIDRHRAYTPAQLVAAVAQQHQLHLARNDRGTRHRHAVRSVSAACGARSAGFTGHTVRRSTGRSSRLRAGYTQHAGCAVVDLVRIRGGRFEFERIRFIDVASFRTPAVLRLFHRAYVWV